MSSLRSSLGVDLTGESPSSRAIARDTRRNWPGPGASWVTTSRDLDRLVAVGEAVEPRRSHHIGRHGDPRDRSPCGGSLCRLSTSPPPSNLRSRRRSPPNGRLDPLLAVRARWSGLGNSRRGQARWSRRSGLTGRATWFGDGGSMRSPAGRPGSSIGRCCCPQTSISIAASRSPCPPCVHHGNSHSVPLAITNRARADSPRADASMPSPALYAPGFVRASDLQQARRRSAGGQWIGKPLISEYWAGMTCRRRSGENRRPALAPPMR